MKKSDAPASQTESEHLDLPDWSGMVDSSDLVSAEAAFELIEKYARWFPMSRDDLQSRRAEKCQVEFVL